MTASVAECKCDLGQHWDNHPICFLFRRSEIVESCKFCGHSLECHALVKEAQDAKPN